ncbi:Transposase IS4 [Phytophthora infestans]|nr:Transposase IS4 [Phytophthora infestans]
MAKSSAAWGRTVSRNFYLMYPMETLNKMLQYTNANLAVSKYRAIDEGDWFRWIGIRLAMAIEPRRGPTRVYWESEAKDGFVNIPANFGERFRMSRHAFENIIYTFAFADNISSDDPWWSIRPFIDEYNAQRAKCVSPGNILVVDECMSAWKDKEAKYAHDGLPHMTKIARMPKGKGTELKAIADGDKSNTAVNSGKELPACYASLSRTKEQGEPLLLTQCLPL